MLRRELEYFFGALRFFTRLPVPAWVGHSAAALNHSARYFPLVGVLVGGLAAAAYALAGLVWPKSLALLLAFAATLLVTGAFHEDGWADAIDGLGGGWTRERILEIMKDSRLGSYGAIALVMLLLTRFVALLETEAALVVPALVAGHALSRLCATLVMHRLDYAREEGKAKPLATRIAPGELALAALCGLAPLLLLPPAAAATGVALALAATLWLGRLFHRWLGGYTGDCLGATQQLAEVAFYLGLTCKFS